MVVGIMNDVVFYAREGLGWIRTLLTKIADFLPIDAQLSLTILFLALSLWIGHFITKRYVTRPLSGSYILWYIIISLSIFLNLMYL